jgi:erythritol transport system permease protein
MKNIAVKKAKSDAPSSSLGMILLKGRTFIALILLFIFFSFTADNFLNPASLLLIAKHVALYGILGIGMTYVIITGGIDLSVGAIVGLGGMIAGGLIDEGLPLQMFGVNLYFNVPAICLIVIILGAIIGAFNGLIITRFNVAPFIATLGMMYVARGFAMLRSNGATFPNLVGSEQLGNTGFDFLGGNVGGLPIAAIILVIIAIITAIVLKKTPTGWHILSIGGNERAAKLSGVKVNKVKILVYVISGACAAVVGLITASQLVAANPSSGESWEMNAIAATVLGGTSMAGGIGTIGGTIVGAFVIGILNDGMVMCGVSEFWQMVIKGVVIVLAVIVDQFQRNMQAKMALQQRSSK